MLWQLFMDGMQLSQDYRATTKRENISLFTAKHSLTPPPFTNGGGYGHPKIGIMEEGFENFSYKWF